MGHILKLMLIEDVGREDIDVSRLTFGGLIKQCGEHWHLRWWLLVRREEEMLVRALSRDVEKVGSWMFETRALR